MWLRVLRPVPYGWELQVTVFPVAVVFSSVGLTIKIYVLKHWGNTHPSNLNGLTSQNFISWDITFSKVACRVPLLSGANQEPH